MFTKINEIQVIKINIINYNLYISIVNYKFYDLHIFNIKLIIQEFVIIIFLPKNLY